MIGDQQLMTGLKTKCTIALFVKKLLARLNSVKKNLIKIYVGDAYG